MGLAGWPASIDDDGTYTVGTRLTAAFFAAIKASIEAAVFSTTNPLVTGEDIIDEVVDARGTMAALDTRLSVSLNDDGTLKSLAGYPTTAEVRPLVKNVFHDDLCLLWPDGDAAAPYKWTLTGGGAAIARCGVGLADTQQMKYGDFCARITYGVAEAKLTKTIIAAAPFGRAGGLAGKKIVFGCWVKSAIANHASIFVDDGVTTTRGGTLGNGTYHVPDGVTDMSFCYCIHTMAAGSSKLDVYLSVAQAGAAYFGNFVLAKSDVAPIDWVPARWGWLVMCAQQRGTLAVTTSPIFVSEARPSFPFAGGGLLYETKIAVKTAPVGADAIWDIDKNATANSAYTTKPKVAAGAAYGDARPDGTYANRCFKEEDQVLIDCDQTGVATVGEEATIVNTFYCPIPDFDVFGV